MSRFVMFQALLLLGAVGFPSQARAQPDWLTEPLPYYVVYDMKMLPENGELSVSAIPPFTMTSKSVSFPSVATKLSAAGLVDEARGMVFAPIDASMNEFTLIDLRQMTVIDQFHGGAYEEIGGFIGWLAYVWPGADDRADPSPRVAIFDLRARALDLPRPLAERGKGGRGVVVYPPPGESSLASLKGEPWTIESPIGVCYTGPTIAFVEERNDALFLVTVDLSRGVFQPQAERLPFELPSSPDASDVPGPVERAEKSYLTYGHTAQSPEWRFKAVVYSEDCGDLVIVPALGSEELQFPLRIDLLSGRGVQPPPTVR